MKFEAIAEKIIALKVADLQLRDHLLQTGQLNDGYNEDMAKLHNENAAILNNIIDTIGYPTAGKVGQEANAAAWLVIQHAIGQPAFMKKCARLLEDVAREEEPPLHLAYLTDRIAVFEGRPQRYGTQFDWDENGKLNPQPFDELTEVNRRRKSVGLNTLEEQTEIIRKRTAAEQQVPPEDFGERKRAFDDWRESVGWVA